MPNWMPEKRGVVIPLKKSSWRLIVKELAKRLPDASKEDQARLRRLLRYIERELDEVSKPKAG